jgi:hypothetical protein
LWLVLFVLFLLLFLVGLGDAVVDLARARERGAARLVCRVRHHRPPEELGAEVFVCCTRCGYEGIVDSEGAMF